MLTAVALLAAGCSKDNTDPVPDPGTGEQLVENPKVRAAVRTMMSEAARTESTLNGVAVWQEGYASSGEWPKGSDNDTRRQMWSVTKTFTSMAVGIAVGEGKLSLSEKVAPMFPEEVAEAEKNMTDAQKANLEALTVRHLLIMANGHKKDPTVEYATEYFKKDPFGSLKYIHNEWVDVSGLLTKYDSTLPELFFGYPFDAAPGEKFCYDSFSSRMLSEIITKKTGGRRWPTISTKGCFRPMGLDRAEWVDIHGVTAGGWGLHLSTDDVGVRPSPAGRLGKWDDSRSSHETISRRPSIVQDG